MLDCIQCVLSILCLFQIDDSGQVTTVTEFETNPELQETVACIRASIWNYSCKNFQLEVSSEDGCFPDERTRIIIDHNNTPCGKK